VAELIAEGKKMTDFYGIGKDLAEKIKEIVKTGKLSLLERLEKELPPGLHELLQIPKLGPKKVKALYEELDIDSLPSLKRAA
jgi:DNA polymerase (family 10)